MLHGRDSGTEVMTPRSFANGCHLHSTSMDIFTLLTQQHRQAKTLLDELAAGEDLSQRGRAELLSELQALFRAHHRIEEGVAYDALDQDQKTCDVARTARQEHECIENLLMRLCSERDEDQWREILEELRKATEAHIEHEESVVFDCLRRVSDSRALDRMIEYTTLERRESADIAR